MKSIRIGAIDYPVEIVQDLASDGEFMDGVITHRPYKICIDAGLGDQGEFVVAWHEVLHAIMTHGSVEEDESTVNMLSYGVAQVLRDNPRMRSQEAWLGQ